jgi:predicted transcriptional regulator
MRQKVMRNKEPIKQELSEILAKYYDGSFARMVSEYIRITGMTETEVDALMEEMKHSSV